MTDDNQIVKFIFFPLSKNKIILVVAIVQKKEKQQNNCADAFKIYTLSSTFICWHY